MDNSPNTSFAVFFKNVSDLFWLCQVALEHINLRTVFVLIGGIFGKGIPRDLGNPSQGFGEGVVVIIYCDNLVPSRLLQAIDYVGACKKMSKMIEHDGTSCSPM
jgi:hypothetical protein